MPEKTSLLGGSTPTESPAGPKPAELTPEQNAILQERLFELDQRSRPLSPLWRMEGVEEEMEALERDYPGNRDVARQAEILKLERKLRR